MKNVVDNVYTCAHNNHYYNYNISNTNKIGCYNVCNKELLYYRLVIILLYT